MSASKILEKAAEQVDNDFRNRDNPERVRWRCWGPVSGCQAIKHAWHTTSGADFVHFEQARQIFNLFRPDGYTTEEYWWRSPELCNKKDNNARVMALLFAAEMSAE